MLPIATLILLMLNAVFLVSLIMQPDVKPIPAPAAEQKCDTDNIIDALAEIKAEIATADQKPTQVAYPNSDKITVVCIAYQIHMRSGNHFWTFLNTETGKPYFCTPHSVKTKIPTIDVEPLPQEYREDLIEP